MEHEHVWCDCAHERVGDYRCLVCDRTKDDIENPEEEEEWTLEEYRDFQTTFGGRRQHPQ